MDVSTGNALRSLRKKYGYTCEQVATIIGVDAEIVESWERTSDYPDADKLVALATLYKSSIDDIVADGEE